MKYLGNKNTMEVHDIDNEKKQCQLNEIKEEHKEGFYTLQQAHAAGFDNCHWCIGNSKR
ncbi:hypothetical protein HN592_03355 [Candidatus Woesearchaeota archaeon]|jgi:hypothetical protein|nr:hypothetical protein [Candidatus Woesearchaeota archaeon]MBT4368249.1 hypothetical protein [Candidatus Woesearchaeota archaeon]MBT4712738.1 hypothetical protein [Candidatus Woesearchaeota archaeon]MBT6639650.1 hypothetical protein [Candidatus Woesearchaeota archaeon]MBT7133822.1 hypothetical protein [Candidatus Woesearchaeota archaeon]